MGQIRMCWGGGIGGHDGQVGGFLFVMVRVGWKTCTNLWGTNWVFDLSFYVSECILGMGSSEVLDFNTVLEDLGLCAH